MSVLPAPEKVLVAALRNVDEIAIASGNRIATRLSGVFPAIRVTVLGGGARLTINTGQADLQVECWAEGGEPAHEAQAADLVQRVEAAVEGGELVGTFPVGSVVGTFMIGNIIHSPDPTTHRERYLLTMGMITQ